MSDQLDYVLSISVSTNGKIDILHANCSGDGEMHGGNQEGDRLQDQIGWPIRRQDSCALPQLTKEHVCASKVNETFHLMDNL